MTTYSADQMRILTQAVMEHLDAWELESEQVLALLGLSDEWRTRHLVSLRKGDKSLPQQEEVLIRAGHIVGIAEALRTTFPFSQQMRLLWLQKPHRRFQKCAPLQVMLREGVDGLQRVRIEVDCAYGYAINDALQAAKNELPPALSTTLPT